MKTLVYKVPDSWHKEYAERKPSEATEWVTSDHVSRICREWEIEDLEQAGFVIGGLA